MREAMPWVLRALVVVLGVQVVVDAGALAGASSTSEAVLGTVGLVVDLAVVIGLWRGSETVRRIVRLAAAIGVGYDALQVARWFGTLPAADPAAGALAGALLAGSLFVLWAVGHRDVQRWTFERWVAGAR